MDDEWAPPLSGAALVDAPEHRAALQKYADELRAMEVPPRSPAPRSDVVTHRELGPLLERIGRAIKQELDRRQAEIEAKQLKLGGTYKDGEAYRENTLVTHQGGLWVSLSDTSARPGSGSPSWRLAVKKGSAA